MCCNGQQRSNHAAPTRGRLLVEGLVVHGAGAIVIDLGGLFARGVTVTVTRGVLLLVPRLLLLLPRLLLRLDRAAWLSGVALGPRPEAAVTVVLRWRGWPGTRMPCVASPLTPRAAYSPRRGTGRSPPPALLAAAPFLS